MHELWKKDTLLWIFAAVVVCLNAAVGSYDVSRMRKSERVLTESRMIHADISALLTDMIDAETGHRGFLLTGEEEFLEPFNRAETNVWLRLDQLRIRLAANADQSEQLAAINRQIRAKFVEMHFSIGLRRDQGLDAASAEIAKGQGKRVMDEFRRTTRDMLNREEDRLHRRSAETDDLYRTADTTNVIAATFAIGVITVAILLERRAQWRRARLTETVALSKAETRQAIGQLDAFLRHAPDGIAIVDADLRFVWVNDKFAAANGEPPGNHLGRSLHELLPDISDPFKTASQTILATGRPLVNRIVFGRSVIWQLNVFRVPLDSGRPGLGVIAMDVTDRHLTQERLRESESRFRNLTESMPQIVWMARADGYYEYFNARWYEYTGLTTEQSVGWDWSESIHPEDLELAKSRWAVALDSGVPFSVEYRIRDASGKYQWFLARAVPVRNPAQEIVRWLGTCTGIDDQKQLAERLEQRVVERTAALSKQQVFLDAILNNVAEGIVACDAGGTLRLFNSAAREMFGLPATVQLQESLTDYYSVYEADAITPMSTNRIPLARALQGEEVRDANMIIRATGRSDRFVLCSGQQLRQSDGTHFGAVVSMRDMTVRREHERQLLQSSAALQASNSELEKFAYIASHDLQEPLRKIQAFGTRLATKHRDALDGQGRDYIDRMLDSAGRMRQLIEDLLSFSRAGARATSFRAVDLNQLAQDVLSDLEVRISTSQATVEIGSLPTVFGDASQLRQVFQNLIGNAIKFARPGILPTVRVEAIPFEQLAGAAPPPPAGTGWRIRFEDNGIGFEPEYSERIFELFQRLHSRSQYDGTGLGLAIVRKIIHHHGARIVAIGRPGEGATFVVDWPARTPHQI